MGLFRILCRRRFLVNGSVCCVSSQVTAVELGTLGSLRICPRNSNIFGQFLQFNGNLQVGSFTTARKFIEAEKERSFQTGGTDRDAEIVCGLLVNQPNTTVDCALDRSGIFVSEELVVEVLKKLSNAGVLALFFFRWAIKKDGLKRTTEMYHHLIEALGKIRQFRLIWELVNAMSGGGLLTKETFSLISRRYVRVKKVKEAIETFEKMGRYGFTAQLSDFNCLIDCLCKSKNVKTAQELVHDMEKRERFFPDLRTCTILLEGWAQLRHIDKVILVYQEMMNKGFEPDQVAYGILIHAFCKCRKLEQALMIFYEMEARNIKPGPHIYCNLINSLGADMRLADALSFLKKFHDSDFSPELPIYNSAIGAYCCSQQYDQAYKMLDEMKRCGIWPNTRSYDVILSHLIRNKKNDQAYWLFQRMRNEDGCKPELNTYTMIVRMFCADRNVDMAIKLWKQMKERGLLPCMHMFLVLISRLCYEKRLEEACNFFNEMLDRGLRPPQLLYNTLAHSLESGGKSDWVVEIGRRLDKVRKTPLNG